MTEMTDEVAKLRQADKGEEPDISLEVAEKAVDSFFDYYWVDTSGQDENTSAIRMCKEKLVKAVMRKRVEFKMEDGNMVVFQYLIKPLKGNVSMIKYRELDGRAKLQMKHNIDTDTSGKIQSLMGALCKMGGAVMANLQGVDLSIMESIGLVFLLA